MPVPCADETLRRRLSPTADHRIRWSPCCHHWASKSAHHWRPPALNPCAAACTRHSAGRRTCPPQRPAFLSAVSNFLLKSKREKPCSLFCLMRFTPSLRFSGLPRLESISSNSFSSTMLQSLPLRTSQEQNIWVQPTTTASESHTRIEIRWSLSPIWPSVGRDRSRTHGQG